MTVTKRTEIELRPLPGRRSGDPLAGVASDSSVRYVELAPTTGRTAHRHPHSEEIIYVVAGSGQVWIDGKRQAVSAGDTIHIAPGVAHATIPDGDMQLLCFFPFRDLASNMEDTTISVEEDE